MNQNECFLKLTHVCDSTPFIDFINTVEMTWGHYTYSVVVPPSLYHHDPLIRAMYLRFGVTVNVFMTPGNTCYNWHQDTFNGCNINCALDVYDSTTLFSELPNPNTPSLRQIVEMKYEANQWYAFNPQKDHMVINQGTKDRYVLVVSTPIEISYKEVVSWYKEKYLETTT